MLRFVYSAASRVRSYSLWYRLSAIELGIYLSPLIFLFVFAYPAGSITGPLVLALFIVLPVFIAYARDKRTKLSDPDAELSRGVLHVWRNAANCERVGLLVVACNIAFVVGVLTAVAVTHMSTQISAGIAGASLSSSATLICSYNRLVSRD